MMLRFLTVYLFFGVYIMSAEETNENAIKLAVVGGSTIDRWGQFFADGRSDVVVERKFTVETSAGTSPEFYQLRHKHVSFYYVKFHGYSDEDTSDRLSGSNFVLVFAALHQLGVTHVIGGATGGGIQPTYRNGDLVIADDLLNFNFERPSSILDAAGIERPGIRARYNPPFCPDIRKILYELASKSYEGRVHPIGTIVQSQPNRYETPAEIRFYRNIGGDFVTHNVATEAIYARQLGMHFAVINSVSNPAEGVRPFTVDEELDVGKKIAAGAIPVVLETLVRLKGHEPECGINCTGERY